MPETEHNHGITSIRNLLYGVALGNRDNHVSKGDCNPVFMALTLATAAGDSNVAQWCLHTRSRPARELPTVKPMPVILLDENCCSVIFGQLTLHYGWVHNHWHVALRFVN